MEFKKQNRVADFFKRFGVYIGAGALALGIIATGLAVGLTQKVQPVTGDPLEFSLPMSSPNVLKDFSDKELQENVTMGEWAAHLSIDIASADGLVYSVLGGNVSKVNYDYMSGTVVEITHTDGFVSIYSSLNENVLVKIGDKVTAGQKIGKASQSATSEVDLGEHLHFTLLLNDKKVDPNNYIALQPK